jgi:MoaA/NifB/PqqE/SkfB family radical SAM enzyme
MYLKQRNWNIDITTRCTLACSECIRTKTLNTNQPLPKVDITLDQFKKLAEFAQCRKIHFCGSWGDPTFNPDFIEMLKVCKEKNIRTYISNAASHQPESWYEKAFSANPDAQWLFGIDGLPEQSHIYRKNQEGPKLFDIMLMAKLLGIDVVWQYIIFDYNKNNVEEAQQLAKMYKLNILFVNTNRNRTMNHV